MSTNNAAIHARVSTPEQKKNYSLPTQIAACQAYALEKGFDVSEDAIFEEDYTGSELFRPKLDKLRELAARGEIEYVLTFKLDRLGRDFILPFIIERELAPYGVQVKYVNGRYDESESGDMMKALDSIVAHQERKNIVERLTRGKRAAVRDGKVIMNRGQVEIYGYKRVNKLYELDEAEKAIVSLIYQWYLDGDDTGTPLGSYQIAVRLNAMGIPTPFQSHNIKRKTRKNAQNDTPLNWHRGTISNILANEAYTGALYYGKTKTVKAPGGKRKLLDVPREEWIPCTIPAIIDYETFERARTKAKQNYKFSPRNTKFDYLMTQRLRCSCCGYTLWGYTPQNRYSYYKCKGTARDLYADGIARCSGVVRSELVDEAVWSTIVELLKNPQQIFENVRDNQAEYKRKTSPIHHSLDSVTALLLEAQQERDRQVRGYTKGTITEAEFEFQGPQLLERIADLTAQRDQLQSQLTAKAIPEHAIDDLATTCERIRQGIDYFTFQDKRDALELLNVTATVQRGKTRQDDVLIVSGYIPTTTVALSDIAYKLQQTPEHLSSRQ